MALTIIAACAAIVALVTPWKKEEEKSTIVYNYRENPEVLDEFKY